LDIPVHEVTNATSGFFQIKGISPNYCEEVKFLSRNNGNWDENSTWLGGDNYNITAKITNNSLVANYLNRTRARLTVRYPNGTIWKERTTNVEKNGYVYFEQIYIPSEPPEYEFGEYEVAVRWNNSFDNSALNETGLIYDTFTVIHDAVLEPESGKYTIKDVPDDIIKTVRFKFYDKGDNTPITEDFANVYTNLSGNVEYLPEVEKKKGIYLLQYNTSEAEIGTNTIKIYGNSSYHLSQEITIEIEVKGDEPYSIVESVLLGLLIGAVAIGTGFGGYFILYHRYLKYPKEIRTLHKFRKSLEKEKRPDISVPDRQASFREKMQTEFAETSKEFGKQGFK
jgi:hypothetical protein